jgi:hypothetical protein
MKRQRRRSVSRERASEHPSVAGGPLRRRQTLRQLHILAQESTHEPSPNAATAHVRVLGDPAEPTPVAAPGPAALSNRILPFSPQTVDPSEGGAPPAPGARIRAVPIDQPVTSSPHLAPEG